MSEAEAKAVSRHAGGRPSDYQPALVESLLAKLAEGNSLNTVCKLAEMPGMSTVFRWLEKHEEFREKYARSCVERREVRKEQLFDIPVDPDLDPARGRLLSDNIKWVLAKEEPKKYGDRQQVDIDAKVEVQQADPASITNQLVTLGTQYPTLNPVIRSLAQSILDRLPELPGADR